MKTSINLVVQHKVFITHPECIFYQYNGILHCKELYSDTIFSFDNGTFIPKYILKQGEAKFTTDLREKDNIFIRTSLKLFSKKISLNQKTIFFISTDGNRGTTVSLKTNQMGLNI